MKELSIEEKAKAYDEAIDKIKYVMEHGVSPTLNKKDLQDIFPELKESEDERIRKAIHIYLDWLDGRNKDYQPKGDCSIKDMIAWLEKQGRQKPTWSEEDEKIITGIINDIQKRLEDYPLEQLAEIYFKEIKWLKSLRKRIEGE